MYPITLSIHVLRELYEGSRTGITVLAKRVPPGARVSGHPRADVWTWTHGDTSGEVVCPYGVPGSPLFVREVYHQCERCAPRVQYRADSGDGPANCPGASDHSGGWRRPQLMPRHLSRAVLVLERSVFRPLQETDHEHALAEGVRFWEDLPVGPETSLMAVPPRWAKGNPLSTDHCLRTPADAFRAFWEHKHQRAGSAWGENPLVFQIRVSVKRAPRLALVPEAAERRDGGER